MLNTSFRTCAVALAITFARLLCMGQSAAAPWQEEVRRYAAKQDWTAAMRIIQEQLARSPQDMDVRGWRARVLTWSAQLPQAEEEYLRIVSAVPNDPDNWMGLASVYARENRMDDAFAAANRAVDLDPKRTDLRLVRARILRALNQTSAARSEYEQLLVLDPHNNEARIGLELLRPETKHQLLLESNTDLFSFAGANQEQGAMVISRWSRHFETALGGRFYRWAGLNADKVNASITGKSAQWGALTLGGALAHDNGVIPKNEAFFAYDHGWRVAHAGTLGGIETNYEQHWFWYAGARIMTLNETATVYFPRDWTWSLRVSGVQSQFPGSGTEWRPAGLSKIGFPLRHSETHHVMGNLFFATGAENYSQVDQIGHFTSHTYGGGLRFQVAAAQDVSGFAAYQQRTNNRTETSFGLVYGIRF